MCLHCLLCRKLPKYMWKHIFYYKIIQEYAALFSVGIQQQLMQLFHHKTESPPLQDALKEATKRLQKATTQVRPWQVRTCLTVSLVKVPIVKQDRKSHQQPSTHQIVWVPLGKFVCWKKKTSQTEILWCFTIKNWQTDPRESR